MNALATLVVLATLSVHSVAVDSDAFDEDLFADSEELALIDKKSIGKILPIILPSLAESVNIPSRGGLWCPRIAVRTGSKESAQDEDAALDLELEEGPEVKAASKEIHYHSCKQHTDCYRFGKVCCPSYLGRPFACRAPRLATRQRSNGILLIADPKNVQMRLPSPRNNDGEVYCRIGAYSCSHLKPISEALQLDVYGCFDDALCSGGKKCCPVGKSLIYTCQVPETALG